MPAPSNMLGRQPPLNSSSHRSESSNFHRDTNSNVVNRTVPNPTGNSFPASTMASSWAYDEIFVSKAS